MAQLSLPASIGPAPFAPTTLAPSAHGGQPFSPVPLFPPGGGGATGSGPIFYFPYFPAGGPIVYVPFDLGEPLSPAVVSGPGLRLAVAAVPEPATWILLACGVLPMLVMLKRQQLAIHVSRLSRLTFAARGHGAVEAAPPVRRTASP